MGLITGLVTLPLAPVRATVWIAERLHDEAERALNDPALLEQQLDDAESALARRELTQEEVDLIEDGIVRRLIARGGL
jgi:hypothetical protein